MKITGYRTLRTACRWATVPNRISAEVQLGMPVGFRLDQPIADDGIVLVAKPGGGTAVDQTVVAAAGAGGDWEEPAGRYVRPVRTGLRLVDAGQWGE